MTDLIQSSSLLLALLNPFLVIVYLIDPVQKLSPKRFRQVLVGAGTIASAVFCCFAIVGEVKSLRSNSEFRIQSSELRTSV